MNSGCAWHSGDMTNLVPIWMPDAPINNRCAIIRPVAMPPAAKMGSWSLNLKSTSWSKTISETGPIWPPDSLPSSIRPSVPYFIIRSAMESVEAKQMTLAPESLAFWISSVRGKLPAKMIKGAFFRQTMSRCAG